MDLSCPGVSGPEGCLQPTSIRARKASILSNLPLAGCACPRPAVLRISHLAVDQIPEADDGPSARLLALLEQRLAHAQACTDRRRYGRQHVKQPACQTSSASRHASVSWVKLGAACSACCDARRAAPLPRVAATAAPPRGGGSGSSRRAVWRVPPVWPASP